MAVPLTCPGCRAAFDVPDELAGKTIRCTSCQTQLTVPAVVVAATVAPTTPAKRSFGAVPAKTSPARPAVKTDVEVDDDEERVRPSKPAARVAKTAKRRDDDEDEDDEDDDDEDDRPTRKGKKAGNPAGVWLMIGGGVGLCALIAVGVWLLMGSGDKKDTASNTSTPAAATTTNNTTSVPSSTGNASTTRPTTGPTPTPTPTPGMPPVPAPTGWQTIQGEGFTFEFPGAPTPGAMMPGIGGVPGARTYMLRNGTEDAVFVVAAPTAQLLSPDQARKQLDEMKQAAVNSTAGGRPRFGGGKGDVSVSSANDITVDGFPGIEVVLGDKSGKGGGGRTRYVIARDRLFVCGGLSDNYAAFTPTVDRVINSLKITAVPPGGVAIGPMNPNPMMPNPMNPNPMMPNPMFPGGDPMMPGGFNPGGELQPGRNPPPPPGALTSPALVADVKPFYAVAFDAEKGEVYTVASRQYGTKVGGTLRRYSYPEFKLKGQYKLPHLATRAALDAKKGLLYLAAVSTPSPALGQAQYDRPMPLATGDIEVIDLAPIRGGKVEEQSEVKPTATIPVGATVRGMELSADGKSLTLVVTRAVTGGKVKSALRLIDAAERKQVKEKELPEVALFMCALADGQQLLVTEYPSDKNKSANVLAYDAATWTPKTIPLPGATTDIAPGRGGRLVAAVIGNGDPRAAKLHVLDGEGGAKELTTAGWKAANNFYAAFTPDGKYLLVSSQGGLGNGGAVANPGLDVYDVGDAADARSYRKVASVREAGGTPLGGYFHVSPDGAFVVFHGGTVLAVDKLTENVAPTPPPPGGNPPPPPGTP